MSLLTSSGINYDPRPSRRLDVTAHRLEDQPESDRDEEPSTLHLELNAEATFNGKDVPLFSPEATCGSGCRVKKSRLESAAPPPAEVEILRFAKQGRTDFSPPGIGRVAFAVLRIFRKLFRSPVSGAGFNWLVTMQDGYPLTGTLSPLSEPQGASRLQLGGRMVITFQADLTARPERLVSRKEPILSGIAHEWPPRLAELKLINPPIEYYRELDVDDSAAEPVLSIHSNTIRFGTKEVTLLKVSPEITSAMPLSPSGDRWIEGPVAGLKLEWTDTRDLVQASEPPVAFYHIYRRLERDDLNGWLLVKSLRANVSTWVDQSFSGTTAAAYAVLHAADYPFGYRYESLIGTPVVVPQLR